MYKIIGVDQKEYGPISADQLRQWIAEGRANGQTKVQLEGSTDWKPLSDFPEFIEALTAKATPALPVGLPPLVDAVNPEALAEQIIARGSEVDIGRCVGRSWDLMTKNFWLVVATTAVVGIIEGCVNAVPYLGAVAGMVIAGVLHGGLYLMFLKLIRGEKAEFGDAFAGFSLTFVQLMLAGLVVGLLISAGILACILPGIYLAVAWLFTFPLVIDKKLDFWPAMELSRKVLTMHWGNMFLLLLVCGLVTLAGVLALCVGVLVAAPVAMAAIVYAYEDIFSGGTNRAG